MKSPCRVDDCIGARYSKGLCELHYRRLLRRGDVDADRPRRGTAEPARCSVDGCGNRADARGWCHGHHQRWLRHGDVKAGEPLSRRKQPESCCIEGCNRRSNAGGYCRTHNNRIRKHGDAAAGTPVKEAAGHGWYSHGYFCVPVPAALRHLTNGETECAEHRLVMAMYLDRSLYPDETVHHRNGNRTDNRIENLELWSSRHPKGQRVEDKVAFAVELLRRYRPEALNMDVE